MTNKKLAWALFDDRTGNRQQLLGILNKLDFTYKKIDIKYNKYAFLPNFLIQLFGGVLHIENKKEFNSTSYPEILIACGRRTAPIAIRLYESFSCKPFLIQLMYPSLTLKKKLYNMIIVPEHDKTPNLNNLYKFFGTPNQMLDLLVKKANKDIKKKQNKSAILVLLGGDHGKYKFTKNLVSEIMKKVLSNLDVKDKVFISTSRRTNLKAIEYLNEEFSLNKKILEIYHPNTSNKNNPLIDFMLESKEIVVTGDSMSMVSEACSIKKKVRIFYSTEICSPKQIFYCKKLIKEGYAFNLKYLDKEKKNIKVLETSKNISDKIKEVFLENDGKNKN